MCDDNVWLYCFSLAILNLSIETIVYSVFWYLGNVIVNGSLTPLATGVPSAKITPAVPTVHHCKET